MTRLMRIAGLEGRCKKRWRKTTVADPEAEAAKDLIQRHFGPCEETRPSLCRGHHLHRHLGGLGLPGHRHRPGQPQGRWLGTRRPHEDRTGRGRTLHGLRQPGDQRRASCSTRTGDANTRARTSPISPGATASCCRSAGKVSAGTTRWPRSFFATIKRELIDTRSWPTRAGLQRARLRVHRRLVQHPPAALDPRLPQPSPVRSTAPPQRRPSSGMINLSSTAFRYGVPSVSTHCCVSSTPLPHNRRVRHHPRGSCLPVVEDRQHRARHHGSSALHRPDSDIDSTSEQCAISNR